MLVPPSSRAAVSRLAIWALPGAALLAAQPVMASTASVANMSALPAIAAQAVGSSCDRLEAKLAAQPSRPATNFQIASKSSAILGGEMSALERMRAQQEQASSAPVHALAVNETVSTIQPAVGLLPKSTEWCKSGRSAAFVSNALPAKAKSAGQDFLESRLVAISHTTFDDDWDRVSGQTLGGFSRPSLDVDQSEKRDMIASINRWVNREIEYVEDRDLFGKADYWAGARLTLALGRGDCEDFAVTKMQILAANGIKRSDMFLTVARDRVLRADHAVLVVRIDNEYVVLDNLTDELLDGAYSQDYLPLLSYSQNGQWIHGI